MKKLLLSLLMIGGAAHSQSWIEQATGFPDASRGINEIDIVDPNTVWAIAYDGSGAGAIVQEFTRTTDGGETWTPGLIEMNDPGLEINNLSAVSADVAFVSALDTEVGMFGKVFRTTDGGMTWEDAIPEGYVTDATLSSFLNLVHFFDANTGITQGDPIGTGVGEYEIYRTTDGGFTWSLLPGSAIPNPATGEYGYNGGNVGAGSRFWFVTNKGNIYRTDDQGATWQKFDTPLTDFAGTNAGGTLYMSDNNIGLILRRTGSGAAATYTVHRTTDGGATWGASEEWTGGSYLLLSYVPGTTTIMATSASNTEANGSQYSNDNGVTWTLIDEGVQRGVNSFLNGTTGWAGGFNQDETTGGIFKFDGVLSVGTSNVAKFAATPNPTNGIMEISNANSPISEVTAFDLLGKQVYSKKFSAVNNAQIDLSAVNTGTYMVRVTDAAGAHQVIKVVKY